MTAIILGWNPERWNDWDYPAVLNQLAATGLFVAPWRVSGNRKITAGADAWLLLQGRHGPGLIGHGIVVSAHAAPAAEQADGSAGLSVLTAFDSLLPFGDQVPARVLAEAVPGVPWRVLHGSPEIVDPADEAGIRAAWAEFGPPPGPDPLQLAPGTRPPDAVTRVQVNRYERDPEARRVCIAHHGTSCAACGFSFEQTYGPTGADFIHVHHLGPAPGPGSSYELDPVTDLVPLCANCHAMAHLGVSSPRTVAELRQLMGAAGYLPGHTVSPEELEAQREARRILGT